MKKLTCLEIAALKWLETKKGNRPQIRVLKNLKKKGVLK